MGNGELSREETEIRFLIPLNCPMGLQFLNALKKMRLPAAGELSLRIEI
jgi:hypothetical protein